MCFVVLWKKAKKTMTDMQISQTLQKYLRNVICNGPIDDVTKAMSCEEKHHNVSHPYMIFYTSLRRKAK